MARNRTNTVEALASAARALGYALENSATLAEAFQKLNAAADPEQREALQLLEQLLRTPESDAATLGLASFSSFPALSWLLRQAPEPEHSAAALLGRFNRQQSFSATAMFAVWSEFAGFLTYLGAVLAVLAVLVGGYASVVMPQFASLYRQFGEPLPSLTSMAFGREGPLFALLLVLAVLLLIFLWWFLFKLRRQLRRFAPLPAACERLPLVGLSVRTYHQYLWLSYAALLRVTGVSAEQALHKAAARVGLHGAELAVEGSMPTNSALHSALRLAAQLGKLDEELEFQQLATADAFLAALARCRRRSRLVLTLCVYYLVATYVAAMYLPLFSLGSLI
jgi:type II secretory pathway component PulF